MHKKFDRVLVIDVEATCWEGKKPDNQQNEIIEIGICTIDIETAQPAEPESIIVKPENSVVSEFCTKLTTITQDMVDNGISFSHACDILKQKYLSKQRVWTSWGNYDKNQFEEQCKAYKVEYPFGSNHINLKTLFSVLRKLPHEVGMAKALELLNIPLKGTHHRGVDDAKNIADIFIELLLK